MNEKLPVLQVKNLSLGFTQYKGLDKENISTLKDINLSIYEGELVAVVGSSGSGKSLLAHSILDILPSNSFMSGEIYYNNKLLDTKKIQEIRGKEIFLVPQGVDYLDPLMKIGTQVTNGNKENSFKEKCTSILKRYGLGKEVEQMYPFELSGGMARRILISTAVMSKPKVVIADEPTPGLHLSVAKRVLGHFKELTHQGTAVLLITHDLELALEVADRVVVLYGGTTLEEAKPSDFYSMANLRHPYTKALWNALPQNDFNYTMDTLPPQFDFHKCIFQEYCEKASDECKAEVSYQEYNGGYVRCVMV